MNFPDFNAQAYENGDFDNGVGLIVHHIKQYNHGLENTEEDRADRQSLQ